MSKKWMLGLFTSLYWIPRARSAQGITAAIANTYVTKSVRMRFLNLKGVLKSMFQQYATSVTPNVCLSACQNLALISDM